jgi:hypothetical protein
VDNRNVFMIPTEVERELDHFQSMCGLDDTRRSMGNMCIIEWKPGEESKRDRQTTADALPETWDATVEHFGSDMATYRRFLELHCPKIIGLAPPDFVIDKGFQPTPAQILQGPAPGKTWYLRQWAPIFDFLPGIPYIPLPLSHLFVAGNPFLWLSHNFMGFPGDEQTRRLLRE